MSDVWEWKDPAAGNDDPPPDGWPEEMTRPDVNDSARENMAAIYRQHRQGEWTDINNEASVVKTDNTSFAVVDTDLTAFYTAKRRVRLLNDVNPDQTATVTSSSVIGVDTVVELSMEGADVVDIAIDRVEAHIVADTATIGSAGLDFLTAQVFGR